MKKFFTTTVFALALVAGEAKAADVFVRFGPPRPPREVVVARPGPGYVWVPGAYRFEGGRYVWARGYWALPPRPHAAWVPGYWQHRGGGHVWISGYWR